MTYRQHVTKDSYFSMLKSNCKTWSFKKYIFWFCFVSDAPFMLRATGELDYSMCAVVASLKNSFNLTYSHYTHFTYFISDDCPVIATVSYCKFWIYRMSVKTKFPILKIWTYNRFLRILTQFIFKIIRY